MKCINDPDHNRFRQSVHSIKFIEHFNDFVLAIKTKQQVEQIYYSSGRFTVLMHIAKRTGHNSDELSGELWGELAGR